MGYLGVLMKGGNEVRILVAAVAAVVLSGVLLQVPGGSRGAVRAGQASVNVAVVPGFRPATYPGYTGVPALPVSASQLAAYHFTQAPAGAVTTTELQSFDTVLLYGIRWSDLSASARAAINTFAATGKVLIWDSDDTGAQSYSTFAHPFSTDASGENGRPNDSVVSFPAGNNFLASADPGSPYYLDPNQLVSDRNMINDMNAMKTGTPDWAPAIVAANKNVPQGGWAVAWTYGDIAKHTGLAIYSGVDADAFSTAGNPNYAVKELALQLGASFSRSADTACAPSCKPPTTTGGKPYASCSFAKPLPRGWVHRKVSVLLRTSTASGLTGKILTANGKTLVSAKQNQAGTLRFAVQTKRLRSNRANRLLAAVYLNGQQACSKTFRLRVDNVRPRLLMLGTSRGGSRVSLTLRLSERSRITINGRRGVKWPHGKMLAGHHRFTFRFPASVHAGRLVLVDRAGNRLVRQLHWR
jgi:hypothetical protein